MLRETVADAGLQEVPMPDRLVPVERELNAALFSELSPTLRAPRRLRRASRNRWVMAPRRSHV